MVVRTPSKRQMLAPTEPFPRKDGPSCTAKKAVMLPGTKVEVCTRRLLGVNSYNFHIGKIYTL